MKITQKMSSHREGEILFLAVGLIVIVALVAGILAF